MGNTTRREIKDFEIGIGTMAWSRSRMLGYGNKLSLEDIRPMFEASLAAGICLFDTAEAYAQSEKLLGQLIREHRRDLFIATKYAPWPWRFSRKGLIRALDRSRSRLGVEQVDLYQIHFPTGFVPQENLWDSLVEAVETGRACQVGVSNYATDLMRRAHKHLAKRGVQLASNQVEYSLVQRAPEINGLLEACQELDIQLIAYSPLGRGALSGRYLGGHGPQDSRRFFNQFKLEELKKLEPVIRLLGEIGGKYQKSAAQVALNWLARQPHVIPIPGANRVAHVESSAGAVGWTLAETEAQQIGEAASRFKRISPDVLGMRF